MLLCLHKGGASNICRALPVTLCDHVELDRGPELKDWGVIDPLQVPTSSFQLKRKKNHDPFTALLEE